MSNKLLEYKGYTGSIEIDLEDEQLLGKILFIRDLVTYEASDINSLKKEFELAVDEYIKDCEALGRDPNKPFTGSFNVRIGGDRHKAIILLARQSGSSINKIICDAIDEFMTEPPAMEIHHHKHFHGIESHEERYIYATSSGTITKQSQKTGSPHNIVKLVS